MIWLLLLGISTATIKIPLRPTKPLKGAISAIQRNFSVELENISNVILK